MAMSIEKLNKKLEKVLKDLDNAIEDRELKKAISAIKSAKDLNKNSEGQRNDDILAELEERVKEITEEIKEDGDLKAKEIEDLKNIRKTIEDGSEPFKNIKTVVDSLEKKDFSQEDLKQYKENQKTDNLAQIEGIKQKNLEVQNVVVDLENTYIEKIDNNDAALKILQQIEENKKKLDALEEGKDDEAIKRVKSDIKNEISEIASIGVDVSSVQDFESKPGVIDTFVTKKDSELKAASNKLAMLAVNDSAIPDSYKQQYDFANIKNAKDLKDRYQKIVGTRQKNSLKITTLEAENKQIDKTIKTLEKEQEIQNIAYTKEGYMKSAEQIQQAVLSKDNARESIDKLLSNRFDFKSPLKRFGARMDYYQEAQGIGKFKAFWKAFTSKTKNVKRIAESSIAVEMGVAMANKATNNMEKRKNDFKETIRKEATKKMSENPKLMQNEIEDDVLKTAYGSVAKEEEETR